jgi:hypothetical protein
VCANREHRDRGKRKRIGAGSQVNISFSRKEEYPSINMYQSSFRGLWK